jgi:hypothetical protein
MTGCRRWRARSTSQSSSWWYAPPPPRPPCSAQLLLRPGCAQKPSAPGPNDGRCAVQNNVTKDEFNPDKSQWWAAAGGCCFRRPPATDGVMPCPILRQLWQLRPCPAPVGAHTPTACLPTCPHAQDRDGLVEAPRADLSQLHQRGGGAAHRDTGGAAGRAPLCRCRGRSCPRGGGWVGGTGGRQHASSAASAQTPRR